MYKFSRMSNLPAGRQELTQIFSVPFSEISVSEANRKAVVSCLPMKQVLTEGTPACHAFGR